MQPVLPLKYASIMFALLWTFWMGWATGTSDLPSLAILAVCGTLAGIGWFYAMRFWFRFIGLLPKDGHPTAD